MYGGRSGTDRYELHNQPDRKGFGIGALFVVIGGIFFANARRSNLDKRGPACHRFSRGMMNRAEPAADDARCAVTTRDETRPPDAARTRRIERPFMPSAPFIQPHCPPLRTFPLTRTRPHSLFPAGGLGYARVCVACEEMRGRNDEID